MIRIFLTNLGKYNEGYLMGEWVDLPIDRDELLKVYERIGLNEEYEEYFISDYEIDDDIGNVDEYSSIDYLNELALFMENTDEETLKLLKALVNCGYYDDIIDAYEHIDSFIFYSDMNMSDLIDDILDSENVSEYIRSYIDYDRLGRDLSLSGYQDTEYGVIVS